jgi:thiol:disulfide interchange protein DsbA
MKRLGRYGPLAAGILALAFAASAAAQLEPGKDYLRINPAQPTASGAKVEVIEFFSYGCPHCGTLQPGLHAWLKKKPADVDFQRFPVVFQDQWLPLAKAYYTFDVMGLVDKTHYAFFRAIHDERTLDVRNLLRDPNPLYDWVAKQGVDRKKFIGVYTSFGIATQANRSIERPANYQVTSTPTLVVDGKYLTSPSMAGSYERVFPVLDQLIAMARKERAARK